MRDNPLEIVAAIARGEDHARPCRPSRRSVCGHRRAMHEVPRPQVPFLVFDDEHALAHQDQEVLLHRLGVVERRTGVPAARRGS